MSIFIAELIGTMFLIILGCGVVAGVLLNHSKAQDSGWMVITLGWAWAVTLSIYAVGKYSGAHLNPAVTLGLAMIDELPWEKVPIYISAQFSGAFLGAVFVYFHYLPHWKKTEDKGLKLAVFATDPAIRSTWSNLFSEASGTFILMFGILCIGANEFSKGFQPLIVGLLILSIGLSLGGTTGYAINPARDFAPRLAHFILPIHQKGTSDWGYAWIPFLGPFLGGIYGALFYQAVFKGITTLPFWIFSGVFIGLVVLAFLKESK